MALLGRKIKVLIVDDSAIVRKLLTEALSKDPEIEVVGTAIDPYVARDKILQLQPDVITLDIEMPRMDGLTFLKIIMQHHPMPVIIMSSLTQSGSTHAMEALQAGAVDILGKPNGSYSVGDMGPQLVEKIKAAAQSKLKRKATSAPAPARPTSSVTSATRPVTAVSLAATLGNKAPAANVLPTPALRSTPRQIILLGASTGGTEALKDVLTRLPANLPGICIVQHIPAYFSRAFADRLNTLCQFEVREAADGDVVKSGLALVAPGNYHMLLRWTGMNYVVSLKQGPPVWHQRPAVDVLFNSAAECVGNQAVCGVLTGMGKDGAEGLLKLRQVGCRTMAQDEETCVVFGMPRAAMELGAAEKMVPLPDFPQAILDGINNLGKKM
jgi:two-component system chemotaxis response regulator CheB